MEKNKDGSFTLTEEEMDEINMELDFLNCLRQMGVGTWPGFDQACELFSRIHSYE